MDIIKVKEKIFSLLLGKSNLYFSHVLEFYEYYMVKKQKKYSWQNRKRRFNILNYRKQLSAKMISFEYSNNLNIPIIYPLSTERRVATLFD